MLLIVAARSRSITNYFFRRPLAEPELIPVVAGGADDFIPERSCRAPRNSDDEPDEDFDEDYERRTLRRMVELRSRARGRHPRRLRAPRERTTRTHRAQDPRLLRRFNRRTLKSDKIWVDLTFAPGTVGTNDIHVNTLLPSGGPTTPLDLKLTLDQPSKGIAPLDVPLIRAGPGHYLATGVTIPLAGQWRVTARSAPHPHRRSHRRRHRHHPMTRTDA